MPNVCKHLCINATLISLLPDALFGLLQGAKRPMGRGKPYGRMGAISAGGYPPKRKTRRGEDPDYAGDLEYQSPATMVACYTTEHNNLVDGPCMSVARQYGPQAFCVICIVDTVWTSRCHSGL